MGDGFTVALFAGASPSPESVSATAETPGIIDGLTVYLGVVLTAVVRAHPQEREERKMHEGGRSASEERHVLISLFDAASGARLDDMEIRAKVGEPGFSQDSKPLQPMHIPETITYGNFFRMPKPGPYLIDVEWRRRGAVNWSGIVFMHTLAQ